MHVESAVQVVMQADRVDCGIQATRCQQCLAGGRKPETIAVHGVVQRLDTKTVPCQEQPLPAFIPDSEGKHAMQVLTNASPETITQFNKGMQGLYTEVDKMATEQLLDIYIDDFYIRGVVPKNPIIILAKAGDASDWGNGIQDGA